MYDLQTLKSKNRPTPKIELDDFTASLIADGCWDLAGVKVSELGLDKAEKLYVKAYQHLIDTGLCWQLQGRISREAIHLISKGDCFANTKK